VKKLQGSVGRGGRNFRNDVRVVQNLLLENGYAPGKVDGMLRMQTLVAIEKFQIRTMKLRHATGLIEPGDAGWLALIGSRNVNHGNIMPDVMDPDSSTWTMGQKIQSLHPDFRLKVQSVLQGMRWRGFEPKIHHAWRSLAEQAKAYNSGNSSVTFSFHNVRNPDRSAGAMAADIIDINLGWGAKQAFWDALRDEAAKAGLYWGGFFKPKADPAHVQLLPSSALSRVKQMSPQ
jgi:hypothetical protein